MSYSFTWNGSPANAAQIKQLRIYDSVGSSYDFLDCLNGDIACNQAKIGSNDAMSRALVQATLQGPVEVGSITIPLLARYLCANGGTGTPSLLDVLTQTTEGKILAPFTAISLPAFGDLPARTIYADSSTKSWKIVIKFDTVDLDGALNPSWIVAYANVPTPDLTMANVGGSNTINLVGSIKDPAACVISTTAP